MMGIQMDTRYVVDSLREKQPYKVIASRTNPEVFVVVRNEDYTEGNGQNPNVIALAEDVINLLVQEANYLGENDKLYR